MIGSLAGRAGSALRALRRPSEADGERAEADRGPQERVEAGREDVAPHSMLDVLNTALPAWVILLLTLLIEVLKWILSTYSS